jgi:hypothetical protein
MSHIEHSTITPRIAKQALLSCIKTKRPAFLWGPPGVGKSDLVQSIADDMEGLMIDLRLGQMDPTEIRGVPFYNRDLGVMDWAPPIELPTEELASKYPIVILFLDEMNSAPTSVQSAAYQLVLNRRVGKYSLPDNVAIIAAGNREGDKGVVYRMPTPLANRFVHLEMRSDFDSWQEWALNNQIHKDVVGYLTFAKQDLCNFDAKTSSRSFATPRSWSFVSDLLTCPPSSDEVLRELISGTIGEGLAVKFMAHRKVSDQMPNPIDILNGDVKVLKTKEISAMYSLVVSMCYELKNVVDNNSADDDEFETEFHRMGDNFIKFMIDNFEPELTVMGVQIALSTYRLPFDPSKLVTYDEFYDKFGKYIMAAVEASS